MPDYQNGKIYMIQPTCACEEGEIYIGSTARARLCDRWDGHKSSFKFGSATSSKILFDKYGIKNCRIILIEAFPCNTKEELTAREAHYIKTRLCVNKHIPMRTDNEIGEKKQKN